jgi:CheY-like chemotaxis protein
MTHGDILIVDDEPTNRLMRSRRLQNEGYSCREAASGQAEVIRRSQPIPEVLADPSTPANTKERLQLVEAALWHEDTEVARCTALRLRRAEVPMPADLPRVAPPPAPDAGGSSLPPWSDAEYRAYHNAAVEHRFVRGSFAAAGPAVDWIRLRVPLIQGEEPSPLSRVAAAADFGNGVSWVLHRGDGYSFINPDLTVYLHRYPVGEWVCLDAVTYPQPTGIGLAESWLFDEQGPIGRAAQSLLIEKD